MTYGPYLAILIDLLGQGEELMKLESLDAPEDQKLDAIVNILSHTAGNVKTVRDWITEFFASLSKVQRSAEELPPEAREGYLRFRAMNFKVNAFSDTIVVSAGLMKDPLLGSAKSGEVLHSALMAVSSVSLAALAAGIPLRAGIDVAPGLDIGDVEVYGPALVRAHRLESKQADYPRAAIGDGLMRFLDWLEQQVDPKPWTGYSAERAKACRALICQAPDDGSLMLHVLSSEVMKLPNHHELPPKVLSWAEAELARHQEANSAALVARYERLIQYFAVSGYPPSTPVS